MIYYSELQYLCANQSMSNELWRELFKLEFGSDCQFCFAFNLKFNCRNSIISYYNGAFRTINNHFTRYRGLTRFYFFFSLVYIHVRAPRDLMRTCSVIEMRIIQQTVIALLRRESCVYVRVYMCVRACIVPHLYS